MDHTLKTAKIMSSIYICFISNADKMSMFYVDIKSVTTLSVSEMRTQIIQSVMPYVVPGSLTAEKCSPSQ